MNTELNQFHQELKLQRTNYLPNQKFKFAKITLVVNLLPKSALEPTH